MNTFARLALSAVAVAAISVLGLTVLRPPSVGPATSAPSVGPVASPTGALGIFAPVAGRILSGFWGVDPIAVDPSEPSRSTYLSLGPEKVLAVGWSSQGTELLIMRQDPTDRSFPYTRHPYIVHADGTETQVTAEAVGGAAISPDGSRVVFAGGGDDDGLYVVDAEGGEPVRIANGEEPTFSSDGTQIAYLGLPRSGCCVAVEREHVWVANADGTGAHEILTDEPALAEGVFNLAWSPAGDRIAIANSGEGHVAIYTFAPDGSDFKKVITGGLTVHWSPDGSQMAYGGLGELSIADADGSNVRALGVGDPGPWHPGTPENAAPTAIETSTPDATPTPDATNR